MSVGQKLAMLKIRSTSATFLSLCNLEAAPEVAMQLRRLIKSSNESLKPCKNKKGDLFELTISGPSYFVTASGPYLFGKFKFWNF